MARFDIDFDDLRIIKNWLDRLEERKYFSKDPVILNAVQLLSEQILSLEDDVDQAIEDSNGKYDDEDQVLQLFLDKELQ
jgi:hypothetical protein|tara:strand:+ start:511 stop:747 length:237 start_codon:yes stop_codon:yes gene_type:complete